MVELVADDFASDYAYSTDNNVAYVICCCRNISSSVKYSRKDLEDIDLWKITCLAS